MNNSSRWPESYQLSQPAKIFWFTLNVILGVIPSILFFAWVERNTALPRIPIELQWPWISLQDSTLSVRILWDVGLFAVFAFFHSYLAQARTHQSLQNFLPPQALRSFYMIFTGGTLLFMMSMWQHTGIILWAIPGNFWVLNFISFAVYWMLILTAGRLLVRFGAGQFIGLQQTFMSANQIGRSSGNPKLLSNGLYGFVRHPVYTFTLLAFVLTPVMSLDRATVTLAMIAYLAIAIPIEERKLIAIFGESYLKYRQWVPAVVPWKLQKKHAQGIQS